MTKHGSPRPSFGDPPPDQTTPAPPWSPPATPATASPTPPAAARLALGHGFAFLEADDDFGALVGLPVDELCGRSLFDFIFPSERQAVIDRLNYAITRRHDRIGCLALRRPDDHTVHIDAEVRYDRTGGEGLWLHCSRLAGGLAGGLVAAAGPGSAGALPAIPAAAERTAPAEPPPAPSEAAEPPVPDPPSRRVVDDGPAVPAAAPAAAARPSHPIGSHHPLAAHRAGRAADGAADGADGLDDGSRQVLALENARGGAMLVVGAGGRVIDGTSAAAARVGWPVELLPGRTLDELFVLSPSARAELCDAVGNGRRRLVPASIVDGLALANLEWLPSQAPGYGFMAVHLVQPAAGTDEHVQALQQAVRLIWHDAGDAVTSLVVGSETLAKLLGADARRPGAARIADALTWHARLIHQAVAELRRVEHGTPVRFEPVDLHAVIGGYLDAVRDAAAEHGVHFVTQLTPGLYVHSTELRVRSIVRNLVTNARQILAERQGGGTIEITTGPAEGETGPGVQIVVRDDGPGMAEALARVIFEPGLSDRPGGTGIGLNLVRQFIVESGGAVQTVTRKGAGTAFVMWLPTVPPEPTDPAVPPPGDPLAAPADEVRP